MNGSIISIQNVVKDYHLHRALDKVSFDIKRGAIHGLLGPNGAGKTTLIRILNRITAPDSGTILFDGHPFVQSDLLSIGYLPEERGLYKKMKVSDQAIYLAQLKGLSKYDAKERLIVWFEKLGIMDWWNKKVEELSKGMAQKIQFVCTVIHEPELFIFDEPFSGFDPINTELLRSEMLELNKKGHTIIFSTHNMQSVEEVCTDITLINRSRVVLNDSITEIKRRFEGQEYMVQMEGLNRSDLEALKGFRIKQERLQYDGNRVELVIEKLASSYSSTDLLRQLILYGTIEKFEHLVPSMNDIFLMLTKGEARDEGQNISE